MNVYRSLSFGQKVRNTELSCMQFCKGEIRWPFSIEAEKQVQGKNYDCFHDCLNLKFENGPFLRELGEIPEGAIPKKFVWTNGMAMKEDEE